MKKLLLAILILSASTVSAAHNHPEKYYQAKWCNEHHGVMEYRLDDQTTARYIHSLQQGESLEAMAALPSVEVREGHLPKRERTWKLH